MKLGSAATVTAVQRQALLEVARQLVTQGAISELTVAGLVKEGIKQQAQRAALRSAQQGLTAAAARYSALSTAAGLIGPVMWAYVGVDLAMKAVGYPWREAPVPLVLSMTASVIRRGRSARTWAGWSAASLPWPRSASSTPRGGLRAATVGRREKDRPPDRELQVFFIGPMCAFLVQMTHLTANMRRF